MKKIFLFFLNATSLGVLTANDAPNKEMLLDWCNYPAEWKDLSTPISDYKFFSSSLDVDWSRAFKLSGVSWNVRWGFGKSELPKDYTFDTFQKFKDYLDSPQYKPDSQILLYGSGDEDSVFAKLGEMMGAVDNENTKIMWAAVPGPDSSSWLALAFTTENILFVECSLSRNGIPGEIEDRRIFEGNKPGQVIQKLIQYEKNY